MLTNMRGIVQERAATAWGLSGHWLAGSERLLCALFISFLISVISFFVFCPNEEFLSQPMSSDFLFQFSPPLH